MNPGELISGCKINGPAMNPGEPLINSPWFIASPFILQPLINSPGFIANPFILQSLINSPGFFASPFILQPLIGNEPR
jgi:hypothetical protein